MPSRINGRFTHWLMAAGLAFIAAAQSASGFTLTQSQESAVKVGMSTTEVQAIPGAPARIHQYRTEPGPTWTHQVVGALFGRAEFNVDFGADGRVTSTGEFIRGSSH